MGTCKPMLLAQSVCITANKTDSLAKGLTPVQTGKSRRQEAQEMFQIVSDETLWQWMFQGAAVSPKADKQQRKGACSLIVPTVYNCAHLSIKTLCQSVDSCERRDGSAVVPASVMQALSPAKRIRMWSTYLSLS